MGVLIRFNSRVNELAHIGAIVRATLRDQDIEVTDAPYSNRIFAPIQESSELIQVFGRVNYQGGLLDILYSSGTIFSPTASAEELAGTGLTSIDGELRFAKPPRVTNQIPLSSILDTAPSADALKFHAEIATKLLESDKID